MNNDILQTFEHLAETVIKQDSGRRQSCTIQIFDETDSKLYSIS
jgi:hypothetical protein